MFGKHDNEIMDFQALLEHLRQNRLLIGVYYYNASLDRGCNEEVYWKQQKFFSDLRRIPGFHIILCNMRKIWNSNGFTYAVKGDDIHIAVDMVSMAYENIYDTAILVSGDGDFVPAIKKAQKLGKKVENAHISANRSNFLRNVCNSSTRLDNVVETFFKEKQK